MNSIKKCAKCEKTVYPIEEIKCLEKVWHKACFKCQTCNMTLNMKTYKGFDRLPYCNAHIPKAKATIVADTPEMKRLAENSKNQSNVKYHAEFEASKGKFTTIADDPEIQRIKANTQTISNISYHGIVEQKAAQEKKRNLTEDSKGSPQEILGPDETTSTGFSVTNSHQQKSQSKEQQSYHSDKSFDRPLQHHLAHGHNRPSSNNHCDIYSGNKRGNSERFPDERISAHQPHSLHRHHTQPPQYGMHQEERFHPRQEVKQKSNKCYQALYDYEAQDIDEVSFLDGDLIINCSPIDEGWMTGTVHRTGKCGMIPANYVQTVNL